MNRSRMSSETVVPSPPPVPSSSTSSTAQSTQSLLLHTQTTPKTRIVVVRTASKTQNEEEETSETDESARAKSVELPPVYTNGNTSVYLIRRPIPPPVEVPKPVQTFPPEDLKQTEGNTTATTSTTTDNLENTSSPTPVEEIVTTPSQVRSLSRRPKRLSSPKKFGSSRRTRRQLRSRKRGSVPSNSSSPTGRISPTDRSPSPPLITKEEPKDVSKRRNFFSFSQTKSTAVQTNLPPPETIETEQRPVRNIRSPVVTRARRKKSATRRIKSAKSIVLVHPEEQTIAVVENPYLRGLTIGPVMKHPKSLTATQFQPKPLKTSQFQQDLYQDNQSTEELVDKTSRWYKCLGCLSRHMCLIITICLILLLIGLAGAGVSAYFLVTNSQTTPEIVGIAIGGILAIAALCFLYCVLGCIGSRDGYFSYNGDKSRIGGRAFALISSSHPNAHLYIPRDYMKMYENNQTPPLTAVSMIPTTQQQIITRPKTVVSETSRTTNAKTVVSENSRTTNAKNVTIEMPERLLTGRKLSPKSHKRKLNKVVNNIGHVVEDAKKRYNDNVPFKVIVKVDKNAKATV